MSPAVDELALSMRPEDVQARLKRDGWRLSVATVLTQAVGALNLTKLASPFERVTAETEVKTDKELRMLLRIIEMIEAGADEWRKMRDLANVPGKEWPYMWLPREAVYNMARQGVTLYLKDGSEFRFW